MRRVFVGSAGWLSGGSDERSRVRCDARDEARDLAGEGPPEPSMVGDGSGDCAGESISWLSLIHI